MRESVTSSGCKLGISWYNWRAASGLRPVLMINSVSTRPGLMACRGQPTLEPFISTYWAGILFYNVF
ncbi:hypothetical protein E2C01_067575 [Portunus trituberculatus]|uniref:Uncharacterized protein n=1 Tax=Portunus trituberculatus TaxID=210409 RepID=A0A5B7HXT1_PORTR|nr:hypothetical protein [Portunus trituberculatus]